MNAHVEIVGEAQEFFAPVSSDVISVLLAQHDSARKEIDEVAEIMASRLGSVLHYFIEGNTGDERTHRTLYLDHLFNVDGAVGALTSAYWSKLLHATDVLDCMPQERRTAWNEQIRNPLGKKAPRLGAYDLSHGGVQKEWTIEPLPPFTVDAVRPTIEGLLAMRSTFFSERVDGIFRQLSRTHVTNAPEGFSKRMILSRVCNEYGHAEHTKAGYINDLRCVIAKFMGRDEPKFHASSSAVQAARNNPGEWITLDGGALRLRCYKNGNGHLEVHPDMAYRLNQVLAHMHPMAIPSQFREKPTRRLKEFEVLGKPLPFAVLEILAGCSPRRVRTGSDFDRSLANQPNTLVLPYDAKDGPALQEAIRVLQSIGGVRQAEPGAGKGWFEFPYNVAPVVAEVVLSGCIPDQQSHQFYPTPDRLADLAVELAEDGAEPGMFWLEPSAGHGALADRMPKGHTMCMELSPLHCSILEAKGHKVWHGDFLAYSPLLQFDRIVMNPPFSKGRAEAHVQHAYSMLRPGGVLVAIVPASVKGKPYLPGADLLGPYSDEFEGTSVSVCIMVARKPKA